MGLQRVYNCLTMLEELTLNLLIKRVATTIIVTQHVSNLLPKYSQSLLCRHPESSKRPTFSELHTSLHKADSLLLEWSEEEKAMYSENARTIGAAFQEGELLHKDLHKKYEMHC